MRRRAGDILSVAGLIAVAAGLLFFPAELTEAAKSGVELSWNVIVPSLFPFFVVAQLTLRLGLGDLMGRLLEPLMRPLFNVSGRCAPALILGFIGGYPVGATTVIGLYSSRRIGKAEAERMLAFSNNSGPAFILGVVGAGIFVDARVGLILYLAHFAASIAVGLIFRFYKRREKPSPGGREAPSAPRESFAGAFVASVKSAFSSSISICGFVCFFTVLIKLLFLSGVLRGAAVFISELFNVQESWVESALTGMIELTSGVWSLRDAAGRLTTSMAMAAFMLGWAGLSIHCQVLSFLHDTGLSSKTYFAGKLLHGLISAAIILLLGRFLPFSAPVSALLADEITGLAGLSFASAITVSAPSAAAALVFFLTLSHFSTKKGGNKGKNRLY